jgi:WD40 repeat protein
VILAQPLWAFFFALSSLSSLIVVGLPSGLVFGLRGRWQKIRGDIQSADSLLWSWRRFLGPVLLISVVLGSAVFAYTSISFQGRLDNSVIVWDAKSGAELATLSGHTNYTNQVTWNADGDQILTASRDGTARVWDAKTGTQLTTLSGHRGSVNQAIWNADGSRILSASDDGTVRIWDTKTGTQLMILPGYQAAWNADGSRILVSSVDRIRVWDAKSGAQLITLPGYQGAWNADGSRILTVSSSNEMHIWDAKSGAELASILSICYINSDLNYITQAAWSADGSRVLTVSRDGTAWVWDVKTGVQLITLSGGAKHILNSAPWNVDDRQMLTASRDAAVQAWDAKTAAQLITFIGRTGGIRRTTWKADGSRILSVSDDGTVRVWDAETGTLGIAVMGTTAGTYSVSFSPDETRFVTTSWPFDFRFSTVAFISTGLILGLFRGLHTSVTEAKTSRDQGIRMSARNAIASGLASGTFAALVGGLTPTFLVLLTDPLKITTLLDFGLQAFSYPLPQLFGGVGIVAALWYGGLDIIQHYTLLVVLRFKGYVPWNYARFLDCATERIFLRKVGGGYIFVHRLLMEYFASLEPG